MNYPAASSGVSDLLSWRHCEPARMAGVAISAVCDLIDCQLLASSVSRIAEIAIPAYYMQGQAKLRFSQ